MVKVFSDKQTRVQYGRNILFLRNMLGLLEKGKPYTREEFASKIGVSKETVRFWERGDNMPTDQTIAVICRMINNIVKLPNELTVDSIKNNDVRQLVYHSYFDPESSIIGVGSDSGPSFNIEKLIGLTKDGVMVVKDGRIVNVNTALLRMTKLSKEDVINSSIESIVKVNNGNTLTSLMSEAILLSKNEDAETQWHYALLNVGNSFNVKTEIAIKYVGGDTGNMFLIVVRNFNALREIVKLNKDNYSVLEQAVIEKEQILQSILQQNKNIMIITDKEMIIQRLSSDAERYGYILFGRPLKIGSNFLLYFNDDHSMRELSAAVLETRQRKESVVKRLLINDLDKNALRTDFVFSPILNENNEVRGYTISAKGIYY